MYRRLHRIPYLVKEIVYLSALAHLHVLGEPDALLLTYPCDLGKGGFGIDLTHSCTIASLYSYITAADAHHAHGRGKRAAHDGENIHRVLVGQILFRLVKDDLHGLFGNGLNRLIGAVSATRVGERAVKDHLVAIRLGVLRYVDAHSLCRAHSMRAGRSFSYLVYISD